QAEDGIRDYKVTGVQRVLFRSAIFGGDMKQQPNSRSFCWPPESCPASRSLTRESVSSSRRSPARASAPACARPRARPAVIRLSRSEERRVGNERGAEGAGGGGG